MDYTQAMEYMEWIGKRGSILGLGPVKTLLARLDNPQNEVKVIHVAGTNGKGSICTFLEAMYRAEGKTVGRYISPTLHTYLERFQVNGIYMTEREFAKLFTRIMPVIQGMEKEGLELPTAFEIETAAAFLFFVQKRVDLVILETGMGGREDATNVVDKPLCTVFASIGMDHMQFLGGTVEQIAMEKAGIMRDGCPVVSYPNGPEVCRVLKQQSSLHNVTPLFVNMQEIEILSETLTGSRFCYQGEEYSIGLAGTYQIYNAATAIACKLLLDGQLDRQALAHVHWEGRFELVSENPLFVKDGAHNMDGAKALYKSLQKHFTNRKIIFIIGVLRDKEYQKMVALLCPLASCVCTLAPDSQRALPAQKLKEAVSPHCADVFCFDSVEEAVHRAKKVYEEYRLCGQQAVIVAWGSLSYMGQIQG
ncbi:MAG: bifunctional folylpolyglutamate synthase/dihydrofolate synthase [Clostridium sp.]|nr:bifunctional folylpolyglutamate synthase/dihydrofolate synthase [Clostridium sp.]